MSPVKVEQHPTRILIVDDDESIAMLLEAALENSMGPGTQVELAHSCAQADEKLADPMGFDLVLLDNFLPDGEGIEILDRITRAKAANREGRPHVMMLSGRSEAAFLEKCFTLGASDYIVKPFNVNLLMLKTQRLLREHWLLQTLEHKNQQLRSALSEINREASLAQFTYDFLTQKTRADLPGVYCAQRSSHAFSGDMTLKARAPGGRSLVMVVDATGHGLSAAITLLPVVSTFTTMARKGFTLASIVYELNRRMLADTPADRFVAAVIVELDPGRGEMHIWNGGMPPLAHYRREGRAIQWAPTQHMALGILEEDQFDASINTVPLDESGYWVIYTDGLVEQQMDDGVTYYGRERLAAALDEHHSQVADRLLRDLETQSGQTNFDDDVTVCVINPSEYIEQGLALQSQQGPVWEAGPFTASLRVRGKQLSESSIGELCATFVSELEMPQNLLDRLLTILTELVMNALDHGILKLDSAVKEEDGGFLSYAQERERRLGQVTNADWVSVELDFDPPLWPDELALTVTDSGPGFEAKSTGTGDDLRVSGRGMQLVQRLSQRVTWQSPGNRCKAIMTIRES